jgi:hypothetical protein
MPTNGYAPGLSNGFKESTSCIYWSAVQGDKEWACSEEMLSGTSLLVANSRVRSNLYGRYPPHSTANGHWARNQI